MDWRRQERERQRAERSQRLGLPQPEPEPPAPATQPEPVPAVPAQPDPVQAAAPESDPRRAQPPLRKPEATPTTPQDQGADRADDGPLLKKHRPAHQPDSVITVTRCRLATFYLVSPSQSQNGLASADGLSSAMAGLCLSDCQSGQGQHPDPQPQQPHLHALRTQPRHESANDLWQPGMKFAHLMVPPAPVQLGDLMSTARSQPAAAHPDGPPAAPDAAHAMEFKYLSPPSRGTIRSARRLVESTSAHSASSLPEGLGVGGDSDADDVSDCRWSDACFGDKTPRSSPTLSQIEALNPSPRGPPAPQWVQDAFARAMAVAAAAKASTATCAAATTLTQTDTQPPPPPPTPPTRVSVQTQTEPPQTSSASVQTQAAQGRLVGDGIRLMELMDKQPQPPPPAPALAAPPQPQRPETGAVDSAPAAQDADHVEVEDA